MHFVMRCRNGWRQAFRAGDYMDAFDEFTQELVGSFPADLVIDMLHSEIAKAKITRSLILSMKPPSKVARRDVKALTDGQRRNRP